MGCSYRGPKHMGCSYGRPRGFLCLELFREKNLALWVRRILWKFRPERAAMRNWKAGIWERCRWWRPNLSSFKGKQRLSLMWYFGLKICRSETFALLGQQVLVSWGWRINYDEYDSSITKMKSPMECFLRISSDKLWPRVGQGCTRSWGLNLVMC